MTPSREIWLTDDAGRRKYLFEKFDSFSYSRTVRGYGTCQLLIPYDKFVADMGPDFHPDYRIDIWRSPEAGVPARREGSFLIRKQSIYQRTTDQMRVLQFDCRSPLDILRRQEWKDAADITDTIDNIMKTIVRGRFVTNLTAYATAPTTLNAGIYTSTGEFAVDGNSSDGPVATINGYMKNVMDLLKELRDASYSLNEASASNRRILFDVVEDNSIGLAGGFGYRFRTFPDRRGRDRTKGTIFSVENGNLGSPTYYEDYLDEITSVFHYNSRKPAWSGHNIQSNDQYLSRWNYIEVSDITTTVTANADLNKMRAELRDGAARKVMNAEFLDSPGSLTQPRSLYGVDWDLGDLLPVVFGGKVMNVEVQIVYVAVNDAGEENISGKSQVGLI